MKEYAKSRVKEGTVPLPCLTDPELRAFDDVLPVPAFIIPRQKHQEPGMKHASGFGVYSNIAPDYYFTIYSPL